MKEKRDLEGGANIKVPTAKITARNVQKHLFHKLYFLRHQVLSELKIFKEARFKNHTHFLVFAFAYLSLSKRGKKIQC